MNRKAEMGIATLVLLTAMIIVSAIVFYALTVSVTQVTRETNAVGQSVRQNIGAAMNVIKLYAEEGDSNNSVDYFYEEIKPPYGSDEINVNKTLLIMALANTSKEYTFNEEIDCSSGSGSDSIYDAGNADYFGVQWVDGAATYANTIGAGELVRLCWKSPLKVGKDEEVVTTFISDVGYVARLQTSYRDLITERTIYFFP